MAAAGSVLIIPLTIMFFFIQKSLIKGLSFGAVKG
jgi:ABC-type maltose transport system permease subunit